MRWMLVGLGLCLQIGAAILYCLFYGTAKQVKSSELPNFIYRSVLKPPFVYLVLAACFWGLGSLCLAIFAFIDFDPVLLFFEFCLVALGAAILRGFKI